MGMEVCKTPNTQTSYVCWQEGGGTTFNAESKSAQNYISLFLGGAGEALCVSSFAKNFWSLWTKSMLF